MYISLVGWLIAYLVLCAEGILSYYVMFRVYSISIGLLVIFGINWTIVIIIIQCRFFVLQHVKQQSENHVDLSTNMTDNSKAIEQSAKCAWFASILANTCSLVTIIMDMQNALYAAILYLLSLCVYHYNYYCSNNGKMKKRVCMCSMYECSFCCMFSTRLL